MDPCIRVIDLETTGFDAPEHQPIEIGWCDLFSSYRDLFGEPTAWDQIGQVISILVAPGRPVPPESSAIHHLIDADLKGTKPWRDVFAERGRDITVFGDDIRAYAAHSARFEKQWLTPDLVGDVPWICTWKCALRAWPEAPGHSNQTLRYWLNPVGLDRRVANVAHRAGPDAYVTAFLLREMLGRHDLATLIRWSEEPATLIRVPFGKRTKGLRWTEVDDGFLDWVLARDFDEDVLFTAKLERDRREKERPAAITTDDIEGDAESGIDPHQAMQQRAVDHWNASHAEGTPVAVSRDDGSVFTTRTRSKAEMLGGHTAVIWLDGIAGAYALDYVRAIAAGDIEGDAAAPAEAPDGN